MPLLNAIKTKVIIAPLGEIKLRSITIDDIEKISKIFEDKNLTDAEFVRKILRNQIVKPQMSPEKFSTISDDDLAKLSIGFIKSEAETFYRYQDTGDLFIDFRKAIASFLEDDLKRLEKVLEPIFQLQLQSQVSALTEAKKSLEVPLSVLRSMTLSDTELRSMLDVVKNVNLQPSLDILKTNSKSLDALGSYWNDYSIINQKLSTNFFSVLEKQILSPQLNLSSELKTASELTHVNRKLFHRNLKTIYAYPEAERIEILSTSKLTPFSLEKLLEIFEKIKESIEIYSHIMFWNAKTEDKLAVNLERIAQGHMVGMLSVLLPGKLVAEFQLLNSGAGIVDILIIFSNEKLELQKVILELKVFGERCVLTDGIEQTAQYMHDQKTEHGFRIIFNGTRKEIQPQDSTASNGKKIRDFIININLPHPSSLDKKRKQ